MQAIINNSVASAKILLIISGGGPSVPGPAQVQLDPPVKPIKQISRMADVEVPKTIEKLEPMSYPVSLAGTYSSDYEWGNCTWYVASRKKVPNSMGDANRWADYLGSLGHTVSGQPMKGAIAQSTAGYWGHVALVEGVSGDQVYVSEMNVDGLNVIDYRWYPISHFNNYIYL